MSDQNSELDRVETLVARHPAGAGRAALEQAYAETFGRPISWRTLVRRLNELARQGRVRIQGKGPSTTYVPGAALVLEAPAAEDGYVPLSREGARVRALVRRPMIERPPVGYDSRL